MVLLLLALGALVACGPDAPEPAASDTPAAWSVATEPALRIGRTEGAAEYLFERISAVELLPGGGVAVAAQGSQTARAGPSPSRPTSTAS